MADKAEFCLRYEISKDLLKLSIHAKKFIFKTDQGTAVDGVIIPVTFNSFRHFASIIGITLSLRAQRGRVSLRDLKYKHEPL